MGKAFVSLFVAFVSHAVGMAAEPVVDIDFAASMAGVPEGTVLRKNAEVMVYGLQALAFGDLNLPGGCQIGKRELPGAFELTATFMTPLEPLRNEKGDPIKAGGCVWDDLYSSGTHRGLQLRFDMVGERWTPRLGPIGRAHGREHELN